MAQFTAQQINSSNEVWIHQWKHNGGWETFKTSMTPVDAIFSNSIFWVEVLIDGKMHNFYSRGAKSYGLEYLD